MRLISTVPLFICITLDIYQMLQSIEGELMEDILEAIKEHPLDPGMKEEGYSFAIQLFRILAANKDICAALMGPNGDMAFVEKIEKLVEDAVLPELFYDVPTECQRHQIRLRFLHQRLRGNDQVLAYR